MFMDTHCHLDLPHFDADRPAVIERAWTAGVRKIVVPGIDIASCRRVLALAEQHEHIYAAVGVHPNDCAGFDDRGLQELRAFAQHPKVVAIGEIGLDYYWNKTPIGQQKAALERQLALAAELRLPVILHSRNAAGSAACNADLLWVMTQMGPEIRKARGADAIIGIWHAFSGDLLEARQAIELGLAIGLGGPLTFQNARRLPALVPELPRDRVVLETDAPYLAPHPHRGRRNEPAYVPLIADRLAELWQISVDAVAEATSATAGRCFGMI
ncbi:MAG: TatD family hydrolase [Anaerolineae bacterium]|nr:TatD family hydrolase [Anaerolineae bacterium]